MPGFDQKPGIYSPTIAEPMPDLTAMPLAELLQYCRPLTQQFVHADESAWHELLRRALVQRNDSAWDALIQRLWPIVLHWIYTDFPDTTPAEAERVAQLAIWSFLQEHPIADFSPNPNMQESATTSSPIPPLPIATQFQQILYRLLPAK